MEFPRQSKLMVPGQRATHAKAVCGAWGLWASQMRVVGLELRGQVVSSAREAHEDKQYSIVNCFLTTLRKIHEGL